MFLLQSKYVIWIPLKGSTVNSNLNVVIPLKRQGPGWGEQSHGEPWRTTLTSKPFLSWNLFRNAKSNCCSYCSWGSNPPKAQSITVQDIFNPADELSKDQMLTILLCTPLQHEVYGIDRTGWWVRTNTIRCWSRRSCLEELLECFKQLRLWEVEQGREVKW